MPCYSKTTPLSWIHALQHPQKARIVQNHREYVVNNEEAQQQAANQNIQYRGKSYNCFIKEQCPVQEKVLKPLWCIMQPSKPTD